MAANKKKSFQWFLLLRDGFLSTLLSLGVCYLLTLFFFNISFFDPVSKALRDFSILDVYYAEKLNENNKVSPDIILLNIEHKSRNDIALALEEVLAADPKVVGFDVILKDFRKTKEDTLLARILENKKIVGSLAFTPSEALTNHPFFKFENRPGFVNFNFDTQNVVIREFETHKQIDGTNYESFASLVTKAYLSKEELEYFDLDKKLKGPRVINYKGDLKSFMHFTIDDFMALEHKQIIKDNIVLIGYLGTPTGNSFDVEDKHFTPLNKTTAGKSVPDMYGMVIHANIINMMVTNDFMYKVPMFWVILLTFLFSLLASIYFIWLDKRLKISYRTVRKGVLLVYAIVMVWITLLLFRNGVVLKTTAMIAVVVFSAGFIKYYKHLVRYLKTKRSFKSYI
ncbi:CHASE2 domain-containing protein [Maribacter chungangensis]|uniref:CHASE2 domain-containing protein n=1 Tax=Maribacter chungangensis TaxID=1069117 RepID=A0ABW3AZM3_9FLAO